MGLWGGGEGHGRPLSSCCRWPPGNCSLEFSTQPQAAAAVCKLVAAPVQGLQSVCGCRAERKAASLPSPSGLPTSFHLHRYRMPWVEMRSRPGAPTPRARSGCGQASSSPALSGPTGRCMCSTGERRCYRDALCGCGRALLVRPIGRHREGSKRASTQAQSLVPSALRPSLEVGPVLAFL